MKDIKVKMTDGEIVFLKSDNICSGELVPLPSGNIGIIRSNTVTKNEECEEVW